MSKVKQLNLEEQLSKLKEDFSILADKLLDQENISDSINNTYRKIHNLKSNLFLIDHKSSLKLVYLMENYFDKLRIGESALSEEKLKLFLSCTEWVKNDLIDENLDEPLFKDLIEKLSTMKHSNRTSALANLNLNSDEKALLRDSRNSGLNIFLLQYSPVENEAVDDFEALKIFKKINDIGMVALKIPVEIEKDTYKINIVFVTDKKQKELKESELKKAVPFDDDLYHSYRDHKILIVEDNPVALLLQKSIMGEFGVCDTVTDGEVGFDLFKLALEEKVPYSIVLLDLVLPGLSGGEILKKMRAEEANNSIKGLDRCKVIVSTTTRESSTLMDLFRAEADAYTFKPLTRDKIVKELEDLKLI